MRVILNADDFGYDDDTTAATIECFEKGALTSATIMPNMPATGKAIAYAKAHPELSFGAHLTFVGDVGERPLSAAAAIPDLVDARGVFLSGRLVFPRGIRRQLPFDQICVEMTTQLAYLRDSGVKLSHVDSHGHTHKIAAFVDALRRVLPQFGLTKVRRGQNVWLTKPWRSPVFWLGGFPHPKMSRYFQTTRGFFMPIAPSDRVNMHRSLRWRPDPLEVGVHPGFAEAWRDAERTGIQALAHELRKRNATPIGWREL